MTPAEPAEPERRREVTWHDPLATAALVPTMSGLEYVRGMVEGRVPHPPIASLMRMRVVAADTGSTTCECDPHEPHYNPIGAVHGGLACTLLATASSSLLVFPL